jgi:hypothetical protein
MTRKEHQKVHQELHNKLDELVADFINHTKKFPSSATVLELMQWSAEQIDNPTKD